MWIRRPKLQQPHVTTIDAGGKWLESWRRGIEVAPPVSPLLITEGCC
jgi:hypothetical protein